MAETIRALTWRTCGIQDIRALLGRGGGHEVIAWGKPSLWKRVLGIDVDVERRGGTNLALDAEAGAQGTPRMFGGPHDVYIGNTYLHESREEVRLKVPPLADVRASIVKRARSLAKSIDPDDGGTEKYVAFLVQTSDGHLHLRGVPARNIPQPLAGWISSQGTGGRKLAGISLEGLERRVWDALMQHHTVLLYGPPGTGKTRIMLKLRHAFASGVAEVGFDPADVTRPFRPADDGIPGAPEPRTTRFVTFHQSLTYENFVVGLRPVVAKAKSGGRLSFAVEDGVFLQAAAEAIEGASLLLIDELNRGNVADIFGELITLLELDKRIAADGSELETTVTVTLPLAPESAKLDRNFRMPHHFYLLASMNSLDRSVAPFDSALRRRFRLIELRPDIGVAKSVLLGSTAPVEDVADPSKPTDIEAKSLAIAILDRINRKIEAFWGPEFMLGHSYVLGVQDAASLIETCSESIVPQLQELYRDHSEGLADLLGTPERAGASALASYGSEAQGLELSGSWNTPLLIKELRDLDIADAVRCLMWLGHERAAAIEEPASE